MTVAQSHIWNIRLNFSSIHRVGAETSGTAKFQASRAAMRVFSQELSQVGLGEVCIRHPSFSTRLPTSWHNANWVSFGCRRRIKGALFEQLNVKMAVVFCLLELLFSQHSKCKFVLSDNQSVP